MKRTAISIAVFLLFFTLLFGVNAQVMKEGERAVLEKNQTVEGNYFTGGELVQIEGTVNGDVYAAGGNVIIRGTVNGDVLAAGGSVTVGGTVTQDVRVAGGQLNINGNVGGNVTAAGGEISFDNDAKVTGSVVVGGGSVSIMSPVGKTATIGGGQVTLANSVGGDTLVGAGQLTLDEGTNIDGNLTYHSEDKATLDDGAVITGETNFQMTKHEERDEKSTKFLGAAFITYKTLSFLAAFLLGVILLKLIPLFVKQAGTLIEQKPLATLGLGFVFLFLTPIAVVLLLFTVVGIPLALFILFGYLAYLYFAKIFVAYLIGEKLIRSKDKKSASVLALFVGLLVYYLVTLIPVIGWIISLLSVMFGTGAALIQKRNSYLLMRSKNQI